MITIPVERPAMHHFLSTRTLARGICLGLVLVLSSGPATIVAADKAAIKQAVDKAAGYLRTIQDKQPDGKAALCTYALIKAGDKATDPGNAKVIAGIVERCNGGSYAAIHGSDGIYAAGIEAMILADVDPEKYKPQLQTIANYMLAQQRPDGAFSYRTPEEPGDISVTQYGALGLWACQRAGIEVPPEAWDKLALWHMKSQTSDGGFQYMPGANSGLTGASPNLTMTAAAASTMTIAAMYLFPEQTSITDNVAAKKAGSAGPPKDPNDPLGVLNVRKPDPRSPQGPSGPYKAQSDFSSIQKHVRSAVGWASKNFTSEYRLDVRMYDYYTLERMGALAEVEELGGRNWFDECAGRLLSSQESDGSWTTSRYDSQGNYAVSTSFGVLFLTRSTAKLLNRTPPPDPIGGGLQAGGRGLPDDLAAVTMQNGRVAKDESLGPLDDLLKSLEGAATDDLFNLQQAIVKKIQLGDRTELIGQTDRLVKLLDYPGPDVRRTALWALARSDDLTMAKHMVAALEDPDRDVLIEAHNALCWLSRRPNAFDIPDDPTGSVPANASEEEKQQALEKWRANALQKWGTWYLRMCSYEEKNTPFAHDLAKKIGLR